MMHGICITIFFMAVYMRCRFIETTNYKYNIILIDEVFGTLLDNFQFSG